MPIGEGPLKEFVDGISNETRRRDAMTMVELMAKVTGEQPGLSGSIVGFGRYDYEYESGRRGTAPAAAFSPRKTATTIYLSDGIGAHSDLLAKLGPHTTGVGCLYIKDLDSVDLEVLTEIVSRSYETLSGGTFGQRAREGTPPES